MFLEGDINFETNSSLYCILHIYIYIDILKNWSERAILLKKIYSTTKHPAMTMALNEGGKCSGAICLLLLCCLAHCLATAEAAISNRGKFLSHFKINRNLNLFILNFPNKIKFVNTTWLWLCVCVRNTIWK